MSCTRHPSKESVGACSNCGKLVCAACCREKEGKTYCYVCEEQLFPAEKAAEVTTPVKPDPVIPLPAAQAATVEEKPPVTAAPVKAEPAKKPEVTPAKEKTLAAEIKTKEESALPVIGGINILWYIAVFFFGWIGGLAAWWKNKKQAPQTSRYLLFGGIGWSALQSVLAVILIVALVMPPSFKTGIKWPGPTTKPPAVTDESQWEEGDVSAQAIPSRRYTPPPVKRTETGTVLTDPPVELATTQVSTGGGTVTVDKPGDPLNGLQITVPEGAYQDSRTFKVSSAPITANTFGDAVNPISPMIIVENGGGSAASPMTLKIPVQVPEGQTVIWYYYDPKSGTLEGAPVTAVDKDSVTVSVIHFSEGFFSSIVSTLMPTEIDSGFRPGTDSWQFVNKGSNLSPGGICEGMSMGAMWYYFTRPDGSDKSLYGRYDNNGKPNEPTPSLWEDDANVIKFCSILQRDYSKFSPKIEIWNPATNSKVKRRAENYTETWEIAGGDNLTRRLFETAMLASYEPQMVGLTRQGGGHAMVCYRIVDGTLKIYDPNYPGGVGEIVWKDGKYQPYKGGEQAGFAGHLYPLITWLPKAALISDWGKIQGWWNDAKSGTLGNGIFPAYKVSVVDDEGNKEEIKDGYETTGGSIKLEIDNNQVKFGVYTADPLFKDPPKPLGAGADGKYQLANQGENMLGIYVTDLHDEWVDFKWFKVKNGAADAEIKIEPPGPQGYANDPSTFKALTKNVPKDAKLEWYFSGQADEKGTKYRDSDTVTHTFKTAGEKTIICQIVKGKEVKPLAKDTVTYKVIQPPIDIIADPPKGAVRQTCRFQPARSNPIPDDAKYTWSFGNGKSGQGEQSSTVYDKAQTYTVSVTATWVVKSAAGVPIQQHTYGELKYEVADALPLRIIADPGTGIAGEKTAFSVQGENLPANVAYHWEFGDANNEGNVSSVQKDGGAGHTYAKEGTYEIKVSMLDKKNPKPLAQATLRYNVEPPVTLTIVAPAEIKQGKGITKKTYTFKSTWEPGKAPKDVSYEWFYEGNVIGTDADKMAAFPDVGIFKINLKAKWKDLRGVAREAVAQLDVNITGTGFKIKPDPNFETTGSGKGVTEFKYMFTPDWSPGTAPAGASYTWWVDGIGVEDQGGKIPYTFKTEGRHEVSAKAAWKDDKGNALTTDTIRFFSIEEKKPKSTLTCTDAELQSSKQGVTKKDYTFKISWDSGKAPAGVKYRWFINGNETGKTGLTETFKFVDEDTITLVVQADWTTAAGKAVFDIAQINFKIESKTALTVRCVDSGLQNSKKGVPDKNYRFYAYWGDGGSAPASVSYTWFLDDEETGDTSEDANLTFTADPASASKAHTVKVTAKWSDSSGAEKTASNFIKFDIGAAPTISIKVPDEIASGKGVINKQYSFTADAPKVPAGADYTWYSGGEAKKQGKDLKSVNNTFTVATDYVLKVEARWTDAGGKTQSAVSPEAKFRIGAAASLAVIVPEEIKAGKGVKGGIYSFGIDAKNIPDDAEYTWYGDGQPRTDPGPKGPWRLKTENEKDYTIKVVAKWTDEAGKAQTLSSPEAKFHIGAAASLSVIVPEEIKAGKGVKGGTYTFDISAKNIPDDAEYTWYGDGQPRTDPRPKGPWRLKCENEKDYTIKVVASWTDENNKKWTVSSPEAKFHIGPAVAVSIIPPAELAKGAEPEKSYYFSAKPEGIPTNAEYAWYLNEKSLGKSSKDKSPAVKTEKEPKEYIVKVTASWNANNQQQQVSGTYSFSTLAGLILTNGQVVGGSGTCEMDNPEQFANIFVGPAVNKIIIKLANNKAVAEQDISFTISDEGRSMPCNAKVKFNGTLNKDVLSGTFSIDAVATLQGEGKSIPIDLKYQGNFTSSALPAKPEGQAVTLTLTGPLRSVMLMKIMAAIASGAIAAMCGGKGSAPNISEMPAPESDVFCTSYTAKIQFTCQPGTKK